jgi:hypothetical protein
LKTGADRTFILTGPESKGFGPCPIALWSKIHPHATFGESGNNQAEVMELIRPADLCGATSLIEGWAT